MNNKEQLMDKLNKIIFKFNLSGEIVKKIIDKDPKFENILPKNERTYLRNLVQKMSGGRKW